MFNCALALAVGDVDAADDFLEKLPQQIRDRVENLGIFVDDATLQVPGKKGTVEDIVVYVGKQLLNAFEKGAGLPISKTKGRVTATSARLCH